jgi:prephenate dehydratase
LEDSKDGKNLDKNHTTFIIIDGDEHEFRKDFEVQLQERTPVILVLIQGDSTALVKILNRIERQLSILVVGVSSSYSL